MRPAGLKLELEERTTVLEELFNAYSEIVKACLDEAVNLIITSRRRLHETIYRELLAKYSGREKRRVNDILHRASKFIARIIAEEMVKPVMEKLTNIRERIW